MFSYTCPICANPVSAPLAPCSQCREVLDFPLFNPCAQCGTDLSWADNPCPGCRDKNGILDEIFVLGPWAGKLRLWLSELKYGGDSRMALWLAEQLENYRKKNWPGSIIVPVPPRRKRILKYGYDPVNLIVKEMRHLGASVEKRLLRKGQKTQKSLGRKERLEAGALNYRLRKNRTPASLEYVLIDDVITTGATLNTCASLLREKGVLRVFAMAVCKD